MKRLGILRALFEVALVAAVILLLRRNSASVWLWRDSVVHGVPTKEKIVALTFDDGPDPRFTLKILDLLDQYQVKATFFMIGKRMEKYPDIVRQVVLRGHAIGNHTYTHPHDIEKDNQVQIVRELDRCEAVIEQLTGTRTHLFRPPRGLVDGSVYMIANEAGYRTILWTVCADHHDAPTPRLMARRVLRLIRPGGIILAHDGKYGTRWKDVAATPLIIESLRRRGYQFVTLLDLLGRSVRSPATVKPGKEEVPLPFTSAVSYGPARHSPRKG